MVVSDCPARAKKIGPANAPLSQRKIATIDPYRSLSFYGTAFVGTGISFEVASVLC